VKNSARSTHWRDPMLNYVAIDVIERPVLTCVKSLCRSDLSYDDSLAEAASCVVEFSSPTTPGITKWCELLSPRSRELSSSVDNLNYVTQPQA
jgi:hypothetical protein